MSDEDKNIYEKYKLLEKENKELKIKISSLEEDVEYWKKKNNCNHDDDRNPFN